MKLTDKITQSILSYLNKTPDIILPNYYWGHYEMDVFRLTQEGYVWEYEVKISVSDYAADFKKGDGEKHKRLQAGEHCPNRFVYVMPTDIFQKIQRVPYAGYVTFDESKWDVNYKRNALNFAHTGKLLRKEPAIALNNTNAYRRLAVGMSFREGAAKAEARFQKSNAECYSKQLSDKKDLFGRIIGKTDFPAHVKKDYIELFSYATELPSKFCSCGSPLPKLYQHEGHNQWICDHCAEQQGFCTQSGLKNCTYYCCCKKD